MKKPAPREVSSPRDSSAPVAAGDSVDPAWDGKKVIVAVTGGIAAYKSAELVSRLVQAGATVRVVMTEAATHFVGALTFQSLSGSTVITSMWQSDDRPDSQHIGLARWCDLVIVAPASADIIAKLAAGICDDVVALTISALPRSPHMTPVLIAPSMNAQMWENPVTQRNIATVTGVLKYRLVGPETGWQACRTKGAGRMSSADDIVSAAAELLG